MSCYERNDGIHSQTGLREVTTCEYSWAKGWIDQLHHSESEGAREEYAGEIAKIDSAEARFFACSPAARADAEEEARAQGWLDADWHERPSALVSLAEEAERRERVLEAARRTTTEIE